MACYWLLYRAGWLPDRRQKQTAYVFDRRRSAQSAQERAERAADAATEAADELLAEIETTRARGQRDKSE